MKLNSVAAVLMVLSVSSAQALNNPFRTKVIYGEDDRLDVLQVQDESLRTLANSTALLVGRPDVGTTEQGGYTLTTEEFGASGGFCSDEPFYSQPTAGFCSGFLVGSDLLVTAGHCIDQGSSCESTLFVFGFDMNAEGKAQTEIPASDVYGCKQVVAHNLDGSLDYAVVKLDRPVINRAPLAIRRQDHVQVGAPLVVIGHPSGLPTKIAGGANVRSNADVGYFVANLDTYGGNSGSAVFNGNTHEVEGILVRGATDFVYDGDCRRSNVCTNDGCNGEEVTDITFLQEFIPSLAR